MAGVYIREQGASIKKQGERMIVTKDKMTLLEIPFLKVEQVSLFGNVQISTQALHILMEKGIDISFFNSYGRYLGHVTANKSKNK